MLQDLYNRLAKLKNPQKEEVFSRFFKTKEGEYGYGDVFLGLTVPESRAIANEFSKLSFLDIAKLLKSKIHEERLIALLILVGKFKKGSNTEKEEIYEFYLKNRAGVNNWDLVDVSADKIIGGYLLEKANRNILVELAHSPNLWERRMAIIATFQFIKEKKEYEDTFKIATILLSDKHDLIQKAVGWMIREVGKRASEKQAYEFLDKNYKIMGRTALRYAIERFPEKLRLRYLKGEI